MLSVATMAVCCAGALVTEMNGIVGVFQMIGVSKYVSAPISGLGLI